MPYRIVHPASMTAGQGPHLAASPFDKTVGEELGVSAFEVYQVELPPGAETVRHTHVDDHVEDVYAFVRGRGWVVVDDVQVCVGPGQFVAVTVQSTRQVRAGDDGLVFIAVCTPPLTLDLVSRPRAAWGRTHAILALGSRARSAPQDDPHVTGERRQADGQQAVIRHRGRFVIRVACANG